MVWPINKIKETLDRKKLNKREKKVIEQYKNLAGFIKDDRMINPDKESRARAWVKEQEETEAKKEKWYQNRPIQAAFITGFITLVIFILSRIL